MFKQILLVLALDLLIFQIFIFAGFSFKSSSFPIPYSKIHDLRIESESSDLLQNLVDAPVSKDLDHEQQAESVAIATSIPSYFTQKTPNTDSVSTKQINEDYNNRKNRQPEFSEKLMREKYKMQLLARWRSGWFGRGYGEL
ncbi:hypothetical protein HK096_001404 [Nowakowskiella sp. JEL0078]|nr:hypothetical protein HK096_001404 [Nowakowskiella sp. JEL0078]